MKHQIRPLQWCIIAALLGGPGGATLSQTQAQAQAQGRAPHRSTLALHARDSLVRLERRLGHAPRTLLRPASVHTPSARVSYVGGFRLPVVGRTPDERARAFVTRYGELLGVAPRDGLSLLGLRSWAGGHVARYRVRLKGFDLWGHSVVVALQGKHVTAAAGGLPPLTSIDPPRPILDPAAVHREVLTQTGVGLHRVLGLGYVVRRGAAILAWRAVQYRAPRAHRWLLVVDATTGAVLSAGPGQREATGYVYDPSPTVAPSYEPVSLPHLTSGTSLTGTYAAARQCGGPHGDGTGEPPCSQHFQGATPDAAGDYLLAPVEPSPSDGFAEVQAYYHVSHFNRWLEDRLGFAWQCASSRRIDVFVNWSYANAFYGDGDGDGCPDITLGESGLDFAYDADVIYHELGHGLVSQTAGLGCDAVGVCLDDLGVNWIPNGLNEGFADYFAMSYTASPALGEHIGQLLGTSHIRTALNDAVCPWDLQSQAHHDGHILMGGAWELRQALGAQRADDLLYGALLTLPEDAEYAEAAAALEQSAEDLHLAGHLNAGDLTTVRQIIGPGGRNMAGCRRVIPLDNRPADKPEQLAYAYPTLPGTLDELPLGLQMTLGAPAGALALELSVEPRYDLGATWRIYLRRGQPATVEVGAGGVDVTADHVFEGSPRSVRLTPTSTPALVGDAVYHVALVYDAPESELFAITGHVEVDPAIKLDGGVTDASPGPDGDAPDDASVPPDGYQPESLVERRGCGCEGAPDAPTGGLATLAVALGLLGLRRRRRNADAPA